MPLRLIEPDGAETLVPDAGAEAAAVQAKAREEAEAKAKAEEEARMKAEAEEKARLEAEAKAKQLAEAKAKKEAEAKAKREAERKARVEAEAKARAEEEARKKAEAERKAKAQAEAKAKKEAEEKAKREAEKKAKEEAERKAREEAEAKARAEEAARKKAEAEEKARLEAEKKAKAEAERQARAEAKAKREAEEKARREAERNAKEEAEAKAKAEEEARKKAEAEEKARIAAEKKAKADAERKAKAAAEAKAKKEAEEKAKREAERKAKEEAEAKAKAEEKARLEAEKKAQAKPKPKAKPRSKKPASQKAKDLGQTFRRLIRETGPISLAHFMAESNAHYYTSRDPLGEEGDFITAPEISQMFGELIGLWFADIWVRMGARKNIHLVELGPGRGTLTQDALRTAARYDFDPQIHFVETSPALRSIQRESFPNVIHHDDLSTLPDDEPLLIIANEFFDALPIHQLVRSAQGWHERLIGLDGDDFVFVAGDKSMDSIVPRSWSSATQGTMIETSAAASAVMTEIAQRLKDQGGAALIIDYGSFELRAGSTLQALRAHEKVDPFDYPGDADLTAHVDFELLKDIAERNGADVMGLEMQGDWLRNMGIDVRHEALKRKNPEETEKLQRQYDRLVDDAQMGSLFKVLGVCGRRWPIGAGFS